MTDPSSPPQWRQPPAPGRRTRLLPETRRTGRRPSLVALAGGALLALGGPALLVAPSGPAAPEPLPAASTTGAPAATPAPAADPVSVPAQGPAPDAEVLTRCPDGLSQWSVSTDAATGARYVIVRLRNCDRTPLELSALPTVRATNGRGATWDPVSTTHALSTVRVGYLREAGFTLQYRAGTVEAGASDFARTFTFGVPGLSSATWTTTSDLAPGADATLSAWQLLPG